MTFNGLFKACAIALVATSFTTAAQAQGFGGLKDRLKKKAANEVIEAITNDAKPAAKSEAKAPSTAPAAATPAAAVVSAPVTQGSPAPKLVSMVKCANLKPSNIIIGDLGTYTFQDGFSSEKRTGLINRKTGSLSDGCILPSIASREVIYMEVDTAAYSAMGSSNDWSMQCVRSANPSAGAVSETQGKTEYPYTVNFLSGKAMMLHCGNSEGIEECAEGSNSSRSGAWDKKLKANGKTMLSVHGNPSTLSPAGGEKLFCQYYNSKTREGLFAFEYLRTRN